MALSKNQIKLITSLALKKNRDVSSLFVAEGNKLVADLLPLFGCELIAATDEWIAENKGLILSVKPASVVPASKEEIKKASAQNAPQSVIAVLRKREVRFSEGMLAGCLTLMLDTVQDPGNLGTIIRIADWFGIRNIICSKETADVYNPKVVQASMGAVGRVALHYCDLCAFVDGLKGKYPLFGTFLDGENIYGRSLPQEAIIVMGNEGNGISDALAEKITDRLLIPNYPAGEETSESLNVAVATAIVCSEFRRRVIAV